LSVAPNAAGGSARHRGRPQRHSVWASMAKRNGRIGCLRLQEPSPGAARPAPINNRQPFVPTGSAWPVAGTAWAWGGSASVPADDGPACPARVDAHAIPKRGLARARQRWRGRRRRCRRSGAGQYGL